jgi:hypothetical protein
MEGSDIAVQEIAEAQAKVGQIESALATARGIEEAVFRARALTTIGSLLQWQVHHGGFV